MLHNHRTWFPVIVVALTALLGVFIYSVFQSRLHTSLQTESTPVTAVEYQTQVHVIVGELRTQLTAATDDQIRSAILATDRDQLLALLVPAEYKDAHLELVMILSQWIAGFKGDTQKITAAQLRFQTLVDQYSWIE